MKGFAGKYDIDIDNGTHLIKDMATQYMHIYNGKFGGGRIMLNPIGLINDGYMELNYMKGVKGGVKYPAMAIGMFNGAKSGGT